MHLLYQMFYIIETKLRKRSAFLRFSDNVISILQLIFYRIVMIYFYFVWNALC